jgi:Tol biopolymer transport system component
MSWIPGRAPVLWLFAAACALSAASLPEGKSAPALSPDGKQVAYVWNGAGADNHDIYAARLCHWPVESCKGPVPAPVRLTTNAAADFGPAWSPDGQQIAFLRKTASGAAVFVVPAKGGAERELGASMASECRLAWSADGKSLALVDRASAGEAPGMFLLSVAGGRKQRLTTPGANSPGDDTPAFSPDGKSLAFSRGAKDGSAAIYVAALGSDGKLGVPRRVSLTWDAPGNRAISGLGWTSDGAGLLIAAGGLWKVPVAGGKAERLAESEGQMTALSVARKGRRVAYSELVPAVEIWRTAGPGSKPSDFPPTRLIGSPDEVGSPNIAPGGRSIAFGSFISGSWEIWKCDRDGRSAIQLTFLGDVPTGSPRWSPDGRFVVFDGRSLSKLLHDIYVVEGNGGAVRPLTQEPATDIRPCYSRDQKWVYFTSNRTGTFQIWKVPAAGGKAEQVTRNGGYIAFETPDGKYLYYGKGRGETTLWRIPSGGGEEVQVLDNVDPSNFAVCALGVVILNMQARPRPGIEFYSFATRKRTSLPVLPKNGKVIGSGTSISVSPDGKWMVYHMEGPISSSIRAREY